MTREEAIGMIKDDMRLHHDYLSGEYRKALKLAISALAQPEIIRCKDCKHLFEDNGCPLRTWRTHTEDDFCSYAERRTDD